MRKDVNSKLGERKAAAETGTPGPGSYIAPSDFG